MQDLAAEYEGLLQFLYACPHGLAQFSMDGTVVIINPAFSCLVMPLVPPGAVFGNLLEALSPWAPEIRALVQAPLPRRGMLCDGLRLHLGPAPEGGDARVLALTLVRLDANRHMAVLSDISAQMAKERRLRESEAWFAALVQGASDYAMLGLDRDGCISEWNSSGERLFRLEAAAVLGRPATGLVLPQGQAARYASNAMAARLGTVRQDGWHLDEGWRGRGDGSRFWGTCMISAVKPPPDESGVMPLTQFLMVVRDTTDQRRSTADLRRALTIDHLTEVMNRRSFFERATQEVKQARHNSRPLCVVMIDADHFKQVNDEHGHAGGDAALRAIADALQGELRESDLLGRLGGEEFAVLLADTSMDEAAATAERLRACVADLPLVWQGSPLPLTISLGVAALGPGTPNLERLLAVADHALYQAKREGRDRVCRAAATPA